MNPNAPNAAYVNEHVNRNVSTVKKVWSITPVVSLVSIVWIAARNKAPSSTGSLMDKNLIKQ
jgi:hypothetical protein